MKIRTKYLSVAAAVMLAVGSVAAADYTSKLVKFSTSADRYADGSPVIDGEWYALCWSPNETFGGMNANCEPLVTGDKVVRVVSLAKDGRCPLTIFVLDGDDAKSNGNYFVYLLDTRTSATTVATDADGDKKPDIVNATNLALGGTEESGATASTSGKFNVATDSSKYETEGVIVTPASLTIETTSSGAIVKAINLNPLVKYNIKYGATISALKEGEFVLSNEDFSGFAGDTVQFSVVDGEANFFQLKRAE